MSSVDLLDPALVSVVQVPLSVESKWVWTGALMPAGGHQGLTDDPDRIAAAAASRRSGRSEITGIVLGSLIVMSAE